MARPIAAFLVALVVYGGALLVLSPSPTGDEPHYALEAVSIARGGDVDLTDEYADPQLVREVAGTPSIAPHAFPFPGRTGAWHSVHNIGLPLLLAPAARVSTSMQWMRAEMVVIAAIGAALLMLLLERVPSGTPRLRWAVWASVVFSAPLVAFAVSVYPEAPAVVLTLAAALALTSPRRRTATLAAASTAAALLPWLNVRFLPVTAVLAAFALWQALRTQPRRGPALAAVLAPLALSGVVLAAAFWAWYGSPSPTAQYALSDSPRTLSGAYRFTFGALVSPAYGWLPQAPLHLLGIAALGLAVARLGRPALWAALGAVLYVVAVGSSGVGFPGTSFPGRLLLVIVPLVAVPLLVLAAERPRWRWAMGALGVVSLALTVALLADPRQLAGGGRDSTVQRRYDDVWPNYSVPGVAAAWSATPGQLRRDAGHLTRTEPLPPGGAAAVVAPPGRAGVLAAAMTVALPADSYGGGVALRADVPTPRTAASVIVTDDRGTVLARQILTGAQIPPSLGYRAILLAFHTGRAGRLTVTVRTTGATTVRVGGMQIGAVAGSTLAGVPQTYPGLGKTIVWVAVVLVAAVAITRRRGTSGTTPRPTAATR